MQYLRPWERNSGSWLRKLDKNRGEQMKNIDITKIQLLSIIKSIAEYSSDPIISINE